MLIVAVNVKLRNTREGINDYGVHVANDVRLRSTGYGTNSNEADSRA